MAKCEISVKIYFGEIEEIIKELGQLQTYKLFDGAEEVLVDINDVARVFEKHVKATSAEPERKTGKWIIWAEDRTEWYHVTCSECVEDVTATIPLIGVFPNYKALWNYCPNCGAKMEE